MLIRVLAEAHLPLGTFRKKYRLAYETERNFDTKNSRVVKNTVTYVHRLQVWTIFLLFI